MRKWNVCNLEDVVDAWVGREARSPDGAQQAWFWHGIKGESDATAVGSRQVDARAWAKWVRAEHASPGLLGGRDADRFANPWCVEAEAPAEAEVAAEQ
ncbi:MAG: hypothetical protein IH827_06915 [Myxococcales bacterium]|nr:hypothetical protein [Myxococcales bacterium]